MSKRAELRRTQREEKRANTATYNLTQAQLDAIVSEKIGKKIAETKKEIYEETVNTVLALVLTLPLEVLMDHYWQKSYRQRLPGFVDKVLNYYKKWQDGEIDMEDLKKDLWEFGGIRLEGATIEEDDKELNQEGKHQVVMLPEDCTYDVINDFNREDIKVIIKEIEKG